MKIYHLGYLILFSAMLSACEKVIDVNLNASDARTVIEASISDQPGPYYVRISKSVNFSEANIFPAVSGAAVQLADDAGNSEILTETSPGVYVSSAQFQGVGGRTYTLDINSDGTNYHAVSYLPLVVNIDTLVTETTFSGDLSIVAEFRDPADRDNYYRFAQIHNGKPSKKIFVQDDKFRNGLYIKQNLYPFNWEDSTKLDVGDSVTITMQSIDKGAYEYLRTLDLIADGGGNGQATPANPISNISNNALGYFSAFSVCSRSINIQ